MLESRQGSLPGIIKGCRAPSIYIYTGKNASGRFVDLLCRIRSTGLGAPRAVLHRVPARQCLFFRPCDLSNNLLDVSRTESSLKAGTRCFHLGSPPLTSEVHELLQVNSPSQTQLRRILPLCPAPLMLIIILTVWCVDTSNAPVRGTHSFRLESRRV
ncbi:hypothetical protein CY34DRAFT_569406 [Suillus luteus UH-Slu-Lm8-n1]|uniref:Uncharacterized protein n=1 Tax=Suillus luteus UH-Slu-Lm8-n1 TaxID=930992 RepID=A0A0D0ABU8_9AGAM|nr:hypothetical protein CY34DRAFT_569406 [Suillus luteus UH-Slu-Lm8-n1]